MLRERKGNNSGDEQFGGRRQDGLIWMVLFQARMKHGKGIFFVRKKHEMYGRVQKALDNQHLKLTVFRRQSEATKKWQNS